jgi:hypothetical protein
VVRDLLREQRTYYHNVEGFGGGVFVQWEREHFRLDWVRANIEGGALIVVDEAQNLFGVRDAEALRFLSYHRHLGFDVWLVCQHRRMLHGDVLALVECEIRAKIGVRGVFVYQWAIGGEVFRTEVVRKEMRVFDAYRSFEFGGSSGVRSKTFLWACGGFALCVGIFALFLINLAPSPAGAGPSRQTAPLTPGVAGVREVSFCEEMDRIREWSPWCVVHVGNGFLRSTWGDVRHLVEVFPGYRLEQRGGRLKSVWLVGPGGEVEAQLGGLLCLRGFRFTPETSGTGEGHD